MIIEYSNSFYDTRDDRRNKVYNATIRLCYEVTIGENDDDDFVSSTINEFHGSSIEDDVEWIDDAHADVGRWNRDKDYDFLVYITHDEYVERPSLTPSEDEMMKIVDPESTLDIIRPYLEEALQTVREKAAHEERVAEASFIAKQIKDKAVERGDKAIDYRKRRDKLDEERRQAINKAANDFIKETEEKGPAYENGQQIDPRVFKAAAENWDEFLSFGFLSSAPDRLDPDKVE